ncbi:MAG: translation initiation factor IF-3 [Oscillospiraceae bacterium]|nr:translation initiation factor IF-3 [Oscillospiraceae bacterium]
MLTCEIRSLIKQNFPFSPCRKASRGQYRAYSSKGYFGIIVYLYGRKFCFRPFLILGVPTISVKELQINEEIKDKELRVIDTDGTPIGVISAKEALALAEEKELDLVKIAPQATPPVCKIMDYGKYLFEQGKREKEAKKNQKVVDIKEIRMFSTIDTNDFNTKVNQAIKFLKSGDKIKVSVRFRKRAIAHPHLGEELLEKFKAACSEYGTVEKPAKMEGRAIVMFVSPKASK